MPDLRGEEVIFWYDMLDNPPECEPHVVLLLCPDGTPSVKLGCKCSSWGSIWVDEKMNSVDWNVTHWAELPKGPQTEQ